VPIITLCFKLNAFLMTKRIGIIVINWNCGNLTYKAITPYLNCESDKIICEIAVVDNASVDDSISILKPLDITLIENKMNMGFGHACNQALKKLNVDYVLLLNPDTGSEPTTLETLTDFLENNPAYAVTGPQQRYENGKVIRCCGRFPSFTTSLWELLGLSKIRPSIFTPAPIMTDFDHIESRDVDHIMGSYMLIRKSVIDSTGFMNEEYFVYGEDIDLSKRISKKGFKSYYNSSNFIIHATGSSGDKASTKRLYYSIDARRIYWKTYYSKTAVAVLTFLSLTIEPLLRIFKSPLQTGTVLKAYFFYVTGKGKG
jgi:GT2 family glycosyltransferase